jgi:hypothetical protein
MLGYKLFGSGLGTLSVSAIVQDVGTAISAAGTSQGTATALTNTLNGLSSVAAGAGVVLYAGSAGDCQLVYNGGANAVRVYPPSGATINGLAANTPHILATNTACEYWFLSATQVFGVLSA